jgi:hypothetical protein
LFAQQGGSAAGVLETSGTTVVVKILTRWTRLVEAMTDVVAGAREQLVVTGSRSREKEYLAAIDTAVAQRPDLLIVSGCRPAETPAAHGTIPSVMGSGGDGAVWNGLRLHETLCSATSAL